MLPIPPQDAIELPADELGLIVLKDLKRHPPEVPGELR
jgi:hypothetical protein